MIDPHDAKSDWCCSQMGHKSNGPNTTKANCIHRQKVMGFKYEACGLTPCKAGEGIRDEV